MVIRLVLLLNSLASVVALPAQGSELTDTGTPVDSPTHLPADEDEEAPGVTNSLQGLEGLLKASSQSELPGTNGTGVVVAPGFDSTSIDPPTSDMARDATDSDRCQCFPCGETSPLPVDSRYTLCSPWSAVGEICGPTVRAARDATARTSPRMTPCIPSLREGTSLSSQMPSNPDARLAHHP